VYVCIFAILTKDTRLRDLKELFVPLEKIPEDILIKMSQFNIYIFVDIIFIDIYKCIEYLTSRIIYALIFWTEFLS